VADTKVLKIADELARLSVAHGTVEELHPALDPSPEPAALGRRPTGAIELGELLLVEELGLVAQRGAERRSMRTRPCPAAIANGLSDCVATSRGRRSPRIASSSPPTAAAATTTRHAWKNGVHAVVLDPLDFIARLCALIPPPRFPKSEDK
jgi:hypothetical protein